MAIVTLTQANWNESPGAAEQLGMTRLLEDGSVLFFPHLTFTLQPEEMTLLSPATLAAKTKNISFNPKSGVIRGFSHPPTSELHALLFGVLNRFFACAQQLIHAVLPQYQNHLIPGLSSFRPAEIKGRVSSYRKDDTRLHVDAFPSRPNQGLRILRVFCNINPNDQPRVWRLGEPFEAVVKRFLPTLAKPMPGSAWLLRLFCLTKSYRTLYDHYMLQLHNQMKADLNYQRKVPNQEMPFPAQTTWIVLTDKVSHAALSGQYLLEQTFYLPVDAMEDQAKSPLRILEKYLDKKLV